MWRVRGLFNVAVELCTYQMHLGGRFILEHPETSKAWKLPASVNLQGNLCVEEAIFDMCVFGMVSVDDSGSAPVLKQTRILILRSDILYYDLLTR